MRHRASGTAAQIDQQHPAGIHPGSAPPLLGGRPAKQQPGQAAQGSGWPFPRAARHASLPRHPGQAVPLPSQLRVVLHSR